MGILKTKGIVIAENNMNDYDKMVTMLTPNGKIGCVAKGARRNRSALMATTQFLCFGEYLIYQGPSSYHINSCEMIEIFYQLRTDLDKLKYAVHITKIINDVTDENQNTYKILQLFLNTLYVLAETDKDMELVISTFKIKLMCLLGFMPMISHCAICRKQEDLICFSFKDSGLKCENCAKQDSGAMQISQATQTAIRYIVMAPPKKLFSFNLSEDNIKELNLIAKLYLNDKLDKEYKLEELF